MNIVQDDRKITYSAEIMKFILLYFSGVGVVTTKSFKKGDFLLEYAGKQKFQHEMLYATQFYQKCSLANVCHSSKRINFKINMFVFEKKKKKKKKKK